MHAGQCMDYAHSRRAFSCAGTACQDHDLAGARSLYGLKLDFVILDTATDLYLFIGRLFAFRISDLPESFLNTDFRIKERRQIDRKVFCVRYGCNDHVFSLDHFIQRSGQKAGVCFQQSRTCLKQLISDSIAVSVFGKFIQCVQQAAAKSHKSSLFKADLCGDRIRCLKPNAPDIIREPVRILPDHVNAVGTILLVYFCRMGSTDIMLLQEQHDILDLFLFQP